MKPVKLKIKGLNSFIEEQEIDFTKLTSKGLFGIFGPTGSGKSSILDAITIALYGKIPRETNEYINTECDTTTVSFQFELCDGPVRRTFIAERNVKRDKKGGYKTTSARLRELNSDDIILAEGANEVKNHVEKLVGLTSEDFTRSVVLPQGKFSEFLKLTGKERRDMLERIFGLEKYGKWLGEKIRKEKSTNIKELNILSGELKRYEGFSEEMYIGEKNNLKSLISQEADLRKEKSIIDREYEKLKQLWELQQELMVYEKDLNVLNEQNKTIDLKREKLRKAKSSNVVMPFIKNCKDTEDKLNHNEELSRKNEEKFIKISQEFASCESEYKLALEKKEKQVPKLIVKETNLSQAIEILNKVKILELERDSLLTTYNKENENKNTAALKLEKLEQEKLKINNSINNIDNTLSNIRVVPEEREKFQLASIKEDEYQELEKKIKDLKTKEKLKTISLETNQKKYSEVSVSKSKIDGEIKKLESRKAELESKKPGDSTMLLKKQENINLLRERLNNAVKLTDNRKGIEKQIDVIAINKNSLITNFNTVSNKIIPLKEHIEHIDEQIAYIEKNSIASKLADELLEGSPCPVCGSMHHPDKAINIEDSSVEPKRTQRDEMKTELKLLEDEYRYAELNLITIKKEEERLSKELDIINKELEGNDIDKLDAQKKDEDVEFEALIDKLKLWEDEYKETDKLFMKLREDKALTDRNEAKLSETVKQEIKALEELQQEIILVQDKHAKVFSEFNILKADLKTENIKERLDQIKKFETESIRLQKEVKRQRELLSKAEMERESLISELKKFEIEVAKILEAGKEKRAVIEKHKMDSLKLSEGENPELAVELVRQNISIIRKEEEKLRLKLQEIVQEKQGISDTRLALEQNKINLLTLSGEQKSLLSKCLNENGFAEEKEAVDSNMTKENMMIFETAIKEYDDKINNIISNISRIKEKLNNESIEESKWKSISESRLKILEELDIKIREIATKEKTLNDMEKEISKLKELSVRKKELDHKYSLLDDLDKLVQGNRFVEFVAMNQLRYIAAEASKRLKDITRGRYALELDSSGNFTMRDDFNGGMIRSTSTLSGGETFLTSLALALSLSSHIQLKGSSPLEFFFLDEGFGTLDSELLETVMSSLERLHTDKLSVGIISHVEELKSRVPVKLNVTAAVPGSKGSSVNIEYS